MEMGILLSRLLRIWDHWSPGVWVARELKEWKPSFPTAYQPNCSGAGQLSWQEIYHIPVLLLEFCWKPPLFPLECNQNQNFHVPTELFSFPAEYHCPNISDLFSCTVTIVCSSERHVGFGRREMQLLKIRIPFSSNKITAMNKLIKELSE